MATDHGWAMMASCRVTESWGDCIGNTDVTTYTANTGIIMCTVCDDTVYNLYLFKCACSTVYIMLLKLYINLLYTAYI